MREKIKELCHLYASVNIFFGHNISSYYVDVININVCFKTFMNHMTFAFPTICRYNYNIPHDFDGFVGSSREKGGQIVGIANGIAGVIGGKGEDGKSPLAGGVNDLVIKVVSSVVAKAAADDTAKSEEKKPSDFSGIQDPEIIGVTKWA